MRQNILLLLIILIAAFLRLWNLGSNPPSLTWDEVAWGYNAYSIGIDGKDEFGRFMPLDYIESFGDFKPILYAYLTVTPIKVFGLNEFAVRFPSALIGVLTVGVVYYLVRQIFKTSQNAPLYALVTALLLAVSPWHIMLSRGAWEANLVPFFISVGVLLFLMSIEGKGRKAWLLPVSAIAFVLSIYSFNSGRVVAPLVVIILGVIFAKKLWKMKLVSFCAIIVGVLAILPTLPHLLSPEASLRFREVNLFSDISVIERINQEITNDNHSFFSRLIHHRFLTFPVEIIRHYFDHFNFRYLFITGDPNPKFSIPEVGLMYLWQFPFFIFGLFQIFRKREGYWWVIFVILLVGIIPAALATDSPHALRIGVTIPSFLALSAYGIVHAYQWLKERNLRKVFKNSIVSIVLLAFIGNIVYFLHGYFYHYPHIFSEAWQYGYKPSIAYVQQNQKNYDEVHITTRLGRPYIYYMFYNKTSPSEFRQTMEVKRESFGFVTVSQVGTYQFIEYMNMNLIEINRFYISILQMRYLQVLEFWKTFII
ncbi:MAG TPA: glycosyltransferase family 39 protein [Candidatus Woesebacteria bacterium]|nr:glycosyltransferase family 39 protein [Candidatus Woesebacteria bacterium]